MSQLYLSAYNLFSAIGWAYVGYQVFDTLSSNNFNFDTGAALWSRISFTLPFVQTLATLEIIHSLMRLVRSPVFPVTVQVFSRLFIVWLCMVPTNGAFGSWSLYLCVSSWVLVEVPRYLFYLFAVNLKGAPHKIPSLLFFLRYNLFLVLYPSGITGELFIAYYSLGDNIFSNATTLSGRLLSLLLLSYLPGSPFMMQNMWINNKKAYKKRRQLAGTSTGSSGSKSKRPLNGLIWPVTDSSTQERSTSKTNKLIWASSLNGIDDGLKDKVEKERNWRFGYSKHVQRNALISAESKENALRIAQNGLDCAYELFEFKRGEKIVSFKEAMDGNNGPFTDNPFETHIIRGGKDRIGDVCVPYGGGKYQGKPYYLGLNDKTVIKGIELKEQLTKWVEYGTIEPSAADAINLVSLNKDSWLDLRNHYFVLLGATSAMGPLYFLLSHGANIIAVDLDRDFIWKKLFSAVRDSAGTLIFPVRKDKFNSSFGNNSKSLDELSDDELSTISGCNLLSDTPEIATWLEEVVDNNNVNISPNAKVTIGNYTYLDGALHVQLSLACDGIINRLCNKRKNTSIAFLCTPTDDHLVPQEAFDAAKSSVQTQVPFWASLINNLTGGKFLGLPNYKAMKKVKGIDLYVIDGIAVAQGPNYALAKRMQHWRSMIAHSNGHTVSTNVAPSTATESVVHNAQFAAAYGGMHLFKPMEVMYQRTSLAVMGLLLIHDVRNNDAVANPKSKLGKKLRNPLELITHGSFHGGVWRCSYKVDKIGVPSAVAYYVSNNIPAVVGGSALLSAATSWVLSGKWVPFL